LTKTPESPTLKAMSSTRPDLKDLATKEDLKKGLNNLESVLRKDLASKKDLVKWKDEILTSNDKVVGKLDDILTEQVAITGNYENLDKRVEKLEEPAGKGVHLYRPPAGRRPGQNF